MKYSKYEFFFNMNKKLSEEYVGDWEAKDHIIHVFQCCFNLNV